MFSPPHNDVFSSNERKYDGGLEKLKKVVFRKCLVLGEEIRIPGLTGYAFTCLCTRNDMDKKMLLRFNIF